MSEIVPLVRWGEIPSTPQDILRTMETLIQGRDIESFVMVSIDSEGEVISAGYGYDNKPFTLVGALEMMKRQVMENIE